MTKRMNLTQFGQTVFDTRHATPLRICQNLEHIEDRSDLDRNETPEEMCLRVGYAVSEPDNHTTASAFADLIIAQEFLPNSPTFYGAGIGGMCSACFTFHVQDNMESIFEVAMMAGFVQKYGGGVGYGLSALRPAGSPVHSTGGVSSGPVGFMPLYQAVADVVTQGGRRHGAQMAILSVDHPDIEAFITCKNENPEKFDTFNISAAITDEFMHRVIQGEPEAASLLRQMAWGAHRTGDPGNYFIDRAERDNPTPQLGKLLATNPCGEVPLLHCEACNLGSINLAKFWVSGFGIEWDRLRQTVKLATHFLDNVVTINKFPHPNITEAVRRTRKIGLGVMGWADLLALEGIHYDTERAVELGSQVMRFIRDAADAESAERGVSLGNYPAFNPEHTGESSMRNATRTCIAPTGTISILAGCSSGIEPHPFLRYNRRVGGTLGSEGYSMMVDEPVITRLRDLGSTFTPKTAHEISPEWHIRHQAAFQQHVDLAVSKTINMPNGATVAEIEAAFILAWKLGCKGVTVYRDGSRDGQVLSSV